MGDKKESEGRVRVAHWWVGEETRELGWGGVGRGQASGWLGVWVSKGRRGEGTAQSEPVRYVILLFFFHTTYYTTISNAWGPVHTSVTAMYTHTIITFRRLSRFVWTLTRRRRTRDKYFLWEVNNGSGDEEGIRKWGQDLVHSLSSLSERSGGDSSLCMCVVILFTCVCVCVCKYFLLCIYNCNDEYRSDILTAIFRLQYTSSMPVRLYNNDFYYNTTLLNVKGSKHYSACVF